VIARAGLDNPELMDTLFDAFFNHFKDKDVRRQGPLLSDEEYTQLASESIGLTLPVVIAKNAGFRVMLMDHPQEKTATVAQREEHMRGFLKRLFARQKDDASLGNGVLTITGGAHINGLLPAMTHGNYRSLSFFDENEAVKVASSIRRSVKQGIWGSFRSWVVKLSGDAVTGNPLAR
jgi:hypothetical protein